MTSARSAFVLIRVGLLLLTAAALLFFLRSFAWLGVAVIGAVILALGLLLRTLARRA